MTDLRALLLSLCLVPLAAIGQDSLEQSFEKDVLVVVGSNACHRFDIYLAIDAQQQRRGLMFVREMPARTGMLFIYRDEDYRSMWMKNTYLPLDMLFARRDGRVSSVERNTVPLSEKSISSTEPVVFVLELNAGTARNLAIDEGSRLIWEPAMP